MNELVTRILAMEKKANEIIDAEKSKLLNIEDEVEKICLEKTKGMQEKEQLRIEKIHELEKKDEEAKIRELEESFSQTITQLTGALRGNKEKLSSEIFDRIISN